MSRHELILVIGATGTQGAAVVDSLIKQGQQVRALTRNVESRKAESLRQRGVQVVAGDPDNPASIAAAMTGVSGVFSMQNPGPNEVLQSRAIVDAARQADVQQLVHTSVSGAGWHKTMSGWTEGRWNRPYWDNKWEAEKTAHDSGLPWVTVLKPAFMMDNFVPPKAEGMFPDLSGCKLLTAVEPHVRIPMIAATDIGAYAAAAFAFPERYAGESIELAGDRPTLPEIADILSSISGAMVVARTLTREELITRGQFDGWVDMQLWFNEVGYPASPEASHKYGHTLLSFSAWAYEQKNSFAIGARSLER